MRNFNFPKVDIHLHLDGSLSALDSWNLAKERSIELPVENFDDFKTYVIVDENCKSLYDCLARFDIPTKVLQDPAALELASYHLVQRLAKQGLVYTEIRFAPQLHTQKGHTQKEAIEAVLLGAQNAMSENPSIEVGIILCCMIMGPASMTRVANLETVELTKVFLGKGVVAMDLAGAEGLADMNDFQDIFDEANNLNIPLTIHAGESTGPETIDKAILMNAKRIGHGHSSIRSEKTIQELIKKKIPLEVCITSNIQCCCYPTYSDHPVKKLYDKGVIITINTDNMVISDTCLDQEYEKLMDTFGFSEKDLIKMNMNSIRYSFMDESKKEAYLTKMAAYL